jgi:hypothetical protein
MVLCKVVENVASTVENVAENINDLDHQKDMLVNAVLSIALSIDVHENIPIPKK